MNPFEQYLRTVKRHTERSIALYQGYLAKFEDWQQQQGLTIQQISYAHLLLYIQDCTRQGYEKRYLNDHLRAIRYGFESLIEQQILVYNPANHLTIRGVGQRIPHDLLDRDALDHLYTAYPTQGGDHLANKVLLGLLVFQALTTQELLPLLASHIDIQKGQIELIGHARRSPRTLPLEASQILPLHQYLIHLPAHQSLFSPSGHYYHIRNQLWALMEALRAINPAVKHALQLRQSVITHWLKIKDIRLVQQWAGHQHISSTERYQATNLATLQADLNRFHPLQ